MVFESLVTDLLNKYLGEYVENLDRSQLKIGIWGGDVVLQDLKLKESALDDLDLPVKTVYGHLGKLVLKIPWKNLYGAPVVASIERLYLLVSPNQEVKYNPEKEEKWHQEAKQSELSKVEEANKADRAADKPKVDQSFVEKLAAQIVKNVQVFIKDIHIRYEDRVTTPEAPFALGITLNSLDVTTIASWGDPVKVDPINLIFKELSVKCLSVYWNSNCTLFSSLQKSDYLNLFNQGIATTDLVPGDYKYMVGPLNSSANLRINTKPELDGTNFSVPKALLKFEMELLQIQISKPQYQDLVVLLETMDRMRRATPYRKYRPDLSSYKGHYKEWWEFAYTCVLEQDVRRRRRGWEWDHMLAHRNLLRHYAEAYQLKLTTKSNSEAVETCTKCEQTLDTLNIILVRQKIEMEVEREGKKHQLAQKESVGGWFSKWWLSSSDSCAVKSEEADLVTQFEQAMTPSEKSKLYRAIDYQEGAPPASYPESFVELDMSIALHSLQLRVVDPIRVTVIEVLFDEVTSNVKKRPTGMGINTSLENFKVLGSKQGQTVPQLVTSLISTDEAQLFEALVETNPLDKKCDQRVHIRSSPLLIIYDALTINNLVDVFTTQEKTVVHQIQAAASMKLAEFKEKSALGLQYMIQQHSILDVQVDLMASYAVLPQNGFYTEDKIPLLVLNLGRIKFFSQPHDSTALDVKRLHSGGKSEEHIMQEMMSRSYDNFQIQLSDLQILLTYPGEKWLSVEPEEHTFILRPTSLTISLGRCIIHDDPRLPKIKIRGQLPSLSFNIIEKRMLKMIALFMSIPFPESSEDIAEPESRLLNYSSMASLASIHLQKSSRTMPAKKAATDEDMVQFKELEVKFELKDVSVAVMRESGVPMIEAHMMSLEAELLQQTFELAIDIRLGGLSAVQTHNRKPVRLITTPMATGSEEYLFVVKYTNVNKDSPEFHSKYHSTLQAIEINFSRLDLYIHLEAMLNLINWSNDIQESIEEARSQKPVLSNRSQFKKSPMLASIKEEGLAVVRRGRMKTRVEVVDVRVTARVGDIEVYLGGEDVGDLCCLGVSGGDANIVVKKSYTQVEAHLKGIYLKDLVSNTNYIECISVKDKEEALVAKIVTFNGAERGVQQVDMLVEMSMACLRFVFINRFIMSLLNFLNNFQAAQEALLEASQAAAEAAKQNVQDAYKNAIRIKLDINLKAPIIIVPVSRTTMDALLLDLGILTISNALVDVPSEKASEPAVLDGIQVDLQNFKLSRVLLDKNLDMVQEHLVLQPISFKLSVQRNLSSSWFTEVPDLEVGGRLGSIHLKLQQTDYSMVLKILELNIGENPVVKAVKVVKPEFNKKPIAREWSKESPSLSRKTSLVAQKPTTPNVPVHTSMRFTLTLDSLVIELYSSEDKGLAKFTLYVISMKGSILSDGSLHTSLLLLDCLLDDTRPRAPADPIRIVRYMERKTASEGCKSMIDITYQQKADAMFIDMRISSFNLILNLEHLLKIGDFFKPLENTSVSIPPPKSPALPHQPYFKSRPTSGLSGVSQPQTPTNLEQKQPTKMMTVNLKLEHPDIILVENLEDTNTNALLLHMELAFKLRAAGDYQNITGSINELQLFTCCYNPDKRDQTKVPVLRPVSIVLAGSTPEGSGMHIDLSTTDIKLSVSPATIQLLSSVYNTVSVGTQGTSNVEAVEVDRSDLWKIEQYHDTDYSFLKTEMGEEVTGDLGSAVMPLRPKAKPLSEVCMFSAPSIVITVEAGVGSSTLPMLLMESSLQATVRDWSSQMMMDSHLTLQVAYYNSKLALWEPLVEPVETHSGGKSTFVPWELSLLIETNPSQEIMSDLQLSSMCSDSSSTPPKAIMVLNISSKEMLSITVSKTFLEVTSQLAACFNQAIYKPLERQPTSTGQYILQNDTGLTITLLLENSDFMLFKENNDDKQMVSNEEVIKEVVMVNEATVPLSPLTEEFFGLNSTQKEKFISINVKQHECLLKLPVVKADKRFFLLNHRGAGNDPWGLVSDVKVHNGTTTITLRSIIQVINHFTVPVSVYFMTKKGNELQLVGTVEPNQSINLPLFSIYTLTNELFFSVEGYTVSVVPFVWKDLQKTLEKTTLMQCNPKNIEDKEPFFIKAIGEIEQVFFENSNKHTMSSTCYNIHIRPTVVLKNLLPVDIVCCVQGIAADKPVKSGEHIQVPTAEPGSSSIVIRIIGYLDREWCCKHEIQLCPPPMSVWTFESYESQNKTTLELGMHTLDKAGSLVMSLYCPFWMLNKTGLMLSYRQFDDAASVLYHPADFKGPIMFSFKAKAFFAKKKSCVRVENGSWSDKFSLDVAGSSGVVMCKTSKMFYQIGVLIQLTYNTLTKQVMFTPYHVLINNYSSTLEFQEGGRPSDKWITVEPNGCAPFWPVEKNSQSLRVRVAGSSESTIPFPCDKVHNTLLRLDNKYGALNVDVQMTEGAVYISLYGYDSGMAPALVINHTEFPIDFCDKARKDNVKVLNPREKVLFCWETTDDSKHFTWLGGKHTNSLREDGIGEMMIGKDDKVFWVSFLYGLQRVLLFTSDRSIAKDAQNVGDLDSFDQEIEIAIHGISLSLVDNLSKVEVLYVGVTSSGVVWETKKTSKKRFKPLSSRESELIEQAYNQYLMMIQTGEKVEPAVHVDTRIVVNFETEQMLKPSLKDLRRTYNTGLWLHICSSHHEYQLHAKINRIQIDNQMFDCVFPVVLSPVPPPKSVIAESTPKPFIEVSIVKRINEYSAVHQYKYFKVLIQEFHIKVDIGFINALAKLFEAGEASEETEVALFQKDKELVSEPLLSHVTLYSSQEQKNFYDILHFSPLKIHVSFSLSGGGHGAGAAEGTPPFVNILLQSFGVTLTDIQDVVLKLSYFERQFSFLTQRQLISEVQMHYVGQLVKQLYVLVFGLDVLGNPYGLVLGFTQGAADLFYEPFQGAIQGPGEFAEGLVLGVRSLFGHTVGGAAGAVSRITGAMGKGLAALTFDEEYQRNRREAMSKRPTTMQEGLAQSSKGLVMGVVEGLGGVITKPISGAKDEGVQGFLKGVGKGVVGLVTRPTAGIVDFAAGSLNAVKRATDMSEEVMRIRTPRHFKTDGLVRPYSKQEAEGNKILMDLEKGKFIVTDVYIFHMPIGSAKHKDVLLITDQRIAYLSHNEIFGGYQLEWSYTWNDMTEPPKLVDNGVALMTSERKKGVRGFFASSESGKVLIVENMETRLFLVETVSDLMKKVLFKTENKASSKSSSGHATPSPKAGSDSAS